MKRSVTTGACVLCACVVIACVALAPANPASARAAAPKSVVAAFYPIAFAAQQVGGRNVTVTNLTPPGAEPHDLELSPKQMDQLLDADITFVMGRGFQPAVERAAEQRDGPTITLFDKLAIGDGGRDPHVWLDPVLMQRLVREVERQLSKVDPSHRANYSANADELVGRLVALDDRYRNGLARCQRNLIVTSHDAFGHLAARYGLRQEGVAGIDPTAEPDAKRITELADLARRQGVTTIFTEELVSPRIADTVAREAGLKTETLDPLEGLSDKKRAGGATYFSVMDANLAKLRTALGCS